jgi:hypothetical protein
VREDCIVEFDRGPRTVFRPEQAEVHEQFRISQNQKVHDLGWYTLNSKV